MIEFVFSCARAGRAPRSPRRAVSPRPASRRPRSGPSRRSSPRPCRPPDRGRDPEHGPDREREAEGGPDEVAEGVERLHIVPVHEQPGRHGDDRDRRDHLRHALLDDQLVEDRSGRGPELGADGPMKTVSRNVEPTHSTPPRMWMKRKTIMYGSAASNGRPFSTTNGAHLPRVPRGAGQPLARMMRGMGAEHPEIDLAQPDNFFVQAFRTSGSITCGRSIRSSGTRSPSPTRASGPSPDTTTSRRSTWTGRRIPRARRRLPRGARRRAARDPQVDARDRPPRHTELRRICSKRLSARGVGKYEDWIREVAQDVLDRALPKGEFDFVPEISRDLPIRFLCSIFTVPQEDAPQLISWGDQMIANQDPDSRAR